MRCKALVAGWCVLFTGCGARPDATELKFFPATFAEPIKVLSKSPTDLIVVVSADEPVLTDVTIDAQRYKQLRVAGFSSQSPTGHPEMPSVEFIVDVPRGMTLAYEILERDMDGGTVLESDLAFQHRLPIHGGAPVYASRDAGAYAVSHGTSPVVVGDVSWAATEKLASVRFFPVSYDAPRRALRTTRQLKVHFYFKPTLSLVDDEPPVGGSARSYNAAKRDLLIAHESHKTTLMRYVEWKKSRGRDVIEHYVAGKSAAEIKDIIRAAYKSASPPTTTMLVGHIEQIPSHRGSGDNTWTDFPYQTLDAGDKPDVALGRVPAHDATELDAFLDKAIARETSQRKVDDVLITAGRDMSLGCPANIKIVGDKFKPARENLRIVRRFGSEGATGDQVLQAYNDAPNLVVYDGHGDQQGMQEIPLLIRDLSKLTNTQFSIILDIACLNANWRGGASQRNFAEKILLQKGAGAAGIMASGGSGYGHEYFQTIASLMAQQPSAEIGAVIMTAKQRHGSQDKSFWNYYGDPASTVWEPAEPTVPTTRIFAALGAPAGESGTSAVLAASVDAPAAEVSYCLGNKGDCQARTSWVALPKLRDGVLQIYASSAPLTMQTGAVTIRARMKDGRDVLKEVAIGAR